ncbi:hypothetical protein ABK040_011145 [Willaertia magna]
MNGYGDLGAFGIILIVFGVIGAVLSVVSAVIYLCYFMSSDDRGKAWCPKLVVLFAFALSVCSIFLLPLDVANTKLDGGLAFVFQVTWQVFYGFVAVFVVLIIPFFIFYYESEDPDKGIFYQIRWGLCATVVTFVIVAVLTGVTYYFFGWADVPFSQYVSEDAYYTLADARANLALSARQYEIKTISIFVSIVIYLIAVILFLGYFVFITCSGCGMTALPVTLIKSFFFRPRRIRSSEFVTIKAKLMNQSKRLIEIGAKLQEAQDEGKITLKERRVLNDFKIAAYRLEEEWKIVHQSFFSAGGSVILPIVYLVLGVLSGLVSIAWIVHLIVYWAIPTPPNGMLNVVFNWLDGLTMGFPILGGALFTFFALYLVLTVLAGNSMITSRLPLISIHPMRKGDTMMNSLMFNTGLILLCTVVINQFTQRAFNSYSTSTAMDIIFSGAVQNLRYIRWFYFAMIYAYLGCCGLGFILALICCREKTKSEKDLNEVLDRLDVGAIDTLQ